MKVLFVAILFVPFVAVAQSKDATYDGSSEELTMTQIVADSPRTASYLWAD